jgi:hypothetical protein
MDKGNYEDARLILQLYELRREEKLRAAREWFAAQFFPESFEDIKALLTPGNPNSVYFRMVVSYWDMAASFAVQGPLNADLLLESSGEMCLVWSRLEKFISELREMIKLPEYLRNIEQVISQVEWAPSRVKWLQQRAESMKAASAS